MKYRFAISALLVILSLPACRKPATPAAYVRFIEDVDNGYSKSVTVGTWKYTIQHKPPTYIYIQEKNGSALNRSELDRRASQLKNWVFFNVYVQHVENRTSSPIRMVGQDMQTYAAIVNYYVSENAHSFRLITPNGEIQPSIYSFENSYNLSPKDVFVVGFEVHSEADKEEMTLAYNDEVLQTGIVNFSFHKSKMSQEPQLQF